MQKCVALIVLLLTIHICGEPLLAESSETKPNGKNAQLQRGTQIEKATNCECQPKLEIQNANLNKELAKINSESKDLRDKLTKLEEKLAKLKQAHDTEEKKYDSRINELKAKLDKCDKRYRKACIAFFITLSIIVGTWLFFLAVYSIKTLKQNKHNQAKKTSFLPQSVISKKSMQPKESIADDDLHCPLCGWRHNPEEKVCKNCKTQF